VPGCKVARFVGNAEVEPKGKAIIITRQASDTAKSIR
jgi:hypothetical protein